MADRHFWTEATLASLLSVAALSSCAAERAPVEASADLVISGATLIDGTGAAARSPTMILVRDGRITSVVPEGPNVAIPDAAEVIDATGKYVVPGLADMHVHFGLGSPSPRGSGTAEAVLARELYYGVTTILQLGATDGSPDAIRQLQARRQSGTLLAPHLYGTGGHLTLQGTHPIYTIFPPDVRRAADALATATPLRDPVDLYSLGIGLSFVRTEEAARKAVRERAEGGMDAIKITVESGPTTYGDDHPQMSVDMIRAIVHEAIRHRLPVIAHISSLDELEAILAGGATGAAHAVWDRPLPDAATADRMAAAGLFVMPTLSLYSGAISLRYIDEPVNLDDPFLGETLSDDDIVALRDPEFIRRFRRGAAVLEEPGVGPSETIRRRVEEVLDNVGMLHRRGVSIVLGTDTGNPYVFPGYSVHRELELLVRAGLTPLEALAAATRRAAEMIGAEGEFGTIEQGKRADLLILGANPLVDIRNTRSIEMVVIDGRVLDRKALRDAIR